MSAPNDTTLLSLQGRIHFLELNYAEAETSLRASLTQNPFHPLAQSTHLQLGKFAAASGNLDEALDHLRRSLRFNEAAANTLMYYTTYLMSAGQHREALNAAETGLEMVNRGIAHASMLIVKILALQALGDIDPANAVMDEALLTVSPGWKVLLAWPLARLGRIEAARDIAAGVIASEHPSPIPAIFIFAGLEDDRVFDVIHDAIDRHTSVVEFLRLSYIFAPQRTDPRWAEVIAHLEREEARMKQASGP